MEAILRLYTEPLPEGHELHCFDEASKQLLSTPRGYIPAKAATVDSEESVIVRGRLKHTDYEYERHGTRNLFVAIAPFTGTRTVTVTKHRKAQDTADFLWQYCMVEHGPRGSISQPKLMQWVLDTLRSRQHENVTNHEEIIVTLQSKVARLERMEETLYDDKLSGLIEPEKYLTKRQQLIQEKNSLNDQLDTLNGSTTLQAEYGIALLELSQKAAKIYPNKTIEQKRLIMSEMFHSISASGDVISVKLSKLAQVIAQKAQETNDKLNGPKDHERQTKNDPTNSVDEGHFSVENELSSSWLGIRFAERELWDKLPNETSVARVKDLLEGEL